MGDGSNGETVVMFGGKGAHFALLDVSSLLSQDTIAVLRFSRELFTTATSRCSCNMLALSSLPAQALSGK